MVDLRFATPVERKKFTCATCSDLIRRGRKCEEPGFQNMRRPMEVGPGSLSYNFCPGKATWDFKVAQLFESCRIAMETGIMPRGTNLEEQDEYFVEALPAFINRWRERNYQRIWDNVGDFTGRTLKAIFGEK